MKPAMTTFVKVGTASADKISFSMPGAASAKSCDPHCQEVTISPSLCCKPLSNLYATEAISFRPIISGGKPLFLTCSVSKCEMLLDCPCSFTAPSRLPARHPCQRCCHHSSNHQRGQ